MHKAKVVAGMSGGVDSSVAAYLLKEQGYDVIGVTMQIWQKEEACMVESNGGCCGLSAVEDARRVASLLGIPHYVMNFRDVFKEKVIDNFVSEYICGNTPNPCIRCNRFVKWESLLERSIQIGAEYIATGHYAAVRRLENGRFAVCKSASEGKDQTYALYNLTQYQLAHTLMPVGGYDKPEIRSIAKKTGLSVADKPDSQEICFIPNNDYGAFLEENTEDLPQGNFVDKQGNILGVHRGIHRYTVGQRKGLNISSDRPLYVCEIRQDTNEIVLGNNEDTFVATVYCKDTNHMAVTNIEECRNITAKIRYGGKEQSCTVKYAGANSMICCFDDKVRAAAPGQAIVFYQNDVVLGGGTIISNCAKTNPHN